MPPKLTPEEKKALAVKKKAARKLKQIENKKQRQRDVLSREINYSSLTFQKHEKEWRKMLINIVLPDMKKDLEFAWHNFERVIDCKDFSISLLMDELRDAEDQYMINYKNNVEHIDHMIELFNERLQELKDDNEKRIVEIRRIHEIQSENLKQDFSEEESYLKTILYILEVAKKEYKQTVRAEYFSKLEEEDTKNVQEIQKLRAILETFDYSINSKIQQFLSDYNNQVKDRKKQYEEMETRDLAMQKILSHQLEKIRQAYENIKRLWQKFGDSQKLLGRKYADLKVEYEFFNSAFKTLKRRLIADRHLDAEKIRILSVSYNDSLQALEKIEEEGEHILHVAAVCRKLETQDEKIRPFPLVTLKELFHDINMTESYKELQLFWQRVGQADASRIQQAEANDEAAMKQIFLKWASLVIFTLKNCVRFALNEEREFLKTENDILQIKISKYCVNISHQQLNNSGSTSKYITEGTIEQKKYAMHNNMDQFPGNTLNSLDDDDYDE